MSETPTTIWPLDDARPGEVVVIARWSPSAGRIETIAALLPELIQQSRAEPGCLGYQAYRPDGADNGDFVLVERYADQSALDAHRNSVHFRTLVLERIVPLLADRRAVVTTVQ
ncbi:putative quinol monooxygenase [Streptomyces sp. NPDC057062]|uniref:putative quinol monooxygenase n=1 Tax=Streptomyces sp. NPDC057062 TaxID=3346011 RepID=UPI0036437E4F